LAHLPAALRGRGDGLCCAGFIHALAPLGAEARWAGLPDAAGSG
jgi:hypothetical protein